jgi:hypothetical protein
MSIIPFIEPIFIEPMDCGGLVCISATASLGGSELSAALEHGHMLEMQEISVAKAGADIQTAAMRRKTQAGRKFMMELHSTPRHSGAGIFEDDFDPGSKMKPSLVL